MGNTDLIVYKDNLTAENELVQTLTLKNDYYKILIRYMGDYKEDLAKGVVSKKKFRYNSRPVDEELEYYTPILSGSDEFITIHTNAMMLPPSDIFFDCFLEFLHAAKETREKVLQYMEERFG